MKNWHAVAIVACAIMILIAALSEGHAAEEPYIPASECPLATDYNTGWVVEDTNQDGIADKATRVYNSGPCKLQAVEPANANGLELEMYP